MGCCGSGTPLWGGSAPSPRPAPPAPVGQPMRYSHAFFEYVGATAMTVTGGATGKTYRFDRPGMRVAVEPVDEPSLRGVPKLRQVYSP
jgi:hypothetical protein